MIKFKLATKASPFTLSPGRDFEVPASFTNSKGPSPLLKKGFLDKSIRRNPFVLNEIVALEKRKKCQSVVRSIVGKNIHVPETEEIFLNSKE